MELGGIGVDRREEVAALLGLVLRLPGAEAFCERAPEAVEPGPRRLEDPSDDVDTSTVLSFLSLAIRTI